MAHRLALACSIALVACTIPWTATTVRATDVVEVYSASSVDDGAAASQPAAQSNPDDDFYTPIETLAATAPAAPDAADDLEPPAWEPLGITVSELSLPTELGEMIAYLATGYVQPHPEMTVEGALDTALTYNHNLNSTRLSAAAACQGVDVRWADLRPQLGLSAKGYWSESNASNEPIVIPVPDGEPIVIDLGGGSTSDFKQQLALSLTQRIYDFGMTYDLIDVAEAQHAIQKYTVDMTEQQLVTDVISAYYRFNLALGQARVRDDELKLSHELLRQAEIQFEVGVVPRLDVIRAEARVEQARSSFIAAQSQVGDTAAYFYSLLGVEDERYVPGVLSAALSEVGPPPVELNEAIANALLCRPEVALQYAALDAGEAAKGLARNRPMVDAYANAIYADPASTGMGTQNYEYGVKLLWNLYSGGSAQSKLKQEQLNIQSIAEGLFHLEAQIELDATTSWNRVVAARSSADAARKTLELSSEAHRVAAVGYSAGVTPYVDYLDALDQNVAAAIGYLVALADVKLAQTNLSRAMGFPFGYPGDGRASSPGDVDIYTTLGFANPDLTEYGAGLPPAD